jgi:hypothetical protein
MQITTGAGLKARVKLENDRFRAQKTSFCQGKRDFWGRMSPRGCAESHAVVAKLLPFNETPGPTLIALFNTHPRNAFWAVDAGPGR